MKQIFKNKYFQIGIAVVIIAAASGGAFYYGYQKGTENPQTVIIRGVNNINNGKEVGVDFGAFWEAWQILKEKYVDVEKTNDNQALVYGAISGLFRALKDPNTSFMPPSDAKKFGEDISGEFSGIGAEIGIRNEQLQIIAPLKDTPAERAGLRSGDKIVKINDEFTNDMTVDEAVKLIRGPKGTKVVLTIMRNGWEKTKEISIVRDTIQIPTLDWKIIDSSGAESEKGDIAYFQLHNFYEKAPFIFYQAAIEAAMKNPQGIILDLRDNPGGYLEVAVNLAGWFLKPGETVVTEEFRGGEKQVLTARGNALFKDVPMVILINQGSASASEIVAGALRDNRGLKLVGKKSFGKGTVQEVANLKNNAVAKITIAYWRLPKGQLIEKEGITPDYDMELTDEDIKNEKDPQLDKALEILKPLIAQSPKVLIAPFYNPTITITPQP